MPFLSSQKQNPEQKIKNDIRLKIHHQVSEKVMIPKAVQVPFFSLMPDPNRFLAGVFHERVRLVFRTIAIPQENGKHQPLITPGYIQQETNKLKSIGVMIVNDGFVNQLLKQMELESSQFI